MCFYRDVGKYLKVTNHTRVCPRHFKAADYLPSLMNEKKILKPAAVPSVFIWKRGSPVKRKSLKKRNPIERKTSVEGSKTMAAKVTNVNFSSTCDLLSTVSKKESKTANSKGEFSARRRVFSVNRFLKSDKDVNFYTGFPGRFVFKKLYKFLYPETEGENINYWHSTRSYQLAHWKIQVSCSYTIPRPRILGPKDEFFLTICRLRQGFKEEHLGHLYGVSQTIVSCIIISWIKFMFLKFSTIPMWPSRTTVDDHMPADFKEKYPSTRVIIDCRGLLSDVRVLV